MNLLEVFKNKKLKPAKGVIAMPKKAFKREHSELVKVLKFGSRADRMKEAKEQGKELRRTK